MVEEVFALSKQVVARAESLVVIRNAIDALCRRLRMDETQTADVKLAVTEACANVVVHAYPEGTVGTLEVEAAAEPDAGELRVVVRDRGGGFEHRRDSPGAGLGLPLIGCLASHVELRRLGAEGATELAMRFPLRTQPPAPPLAA